MSSKLIFKTRRPASSNSTFDIPIFLTLTNGSPILKKIFTSPFFITLWNRINIHEFLHSIARRRLRIIADMKLLGLRFSPQTYTGSNAKLTFPWYIDQYDTCLYLFPRTFVSTIITEAIDEQNLFGGLAVKCSWTTARTPAVHNLPEDPYQAAGFPHGKRKTGAHDTGVQGKEAKKGARFTLLDHGTQGRLNLLTMTN